MLTGACRQDSSAGLIQEDHSDEYRRAVGASGIDQIRSVPAAQFVCLKRNCGQVEMLFAFPSEKDFDFVGFSL